MPPPRPKKKVAKKKVAKKKVATKTAARLGRADFLAALLAAPNALCRDHLAQLRQLRDRPFDSEAAGLNEALVWVTSYRLPAKGKGLLLGSAAGAPLPAKIPEQQLQVIRDAISDVPVDLRARIQDVLWEARRSAEAAVAAPRAYLEAAHALAPTAPAVLVARRVDRAFGITRMRRADETELCRLALDFVRTKSHPEPCRVLVASVLAERRIDDLDQVVEVVEPLVRGVVPNSPPPGTFDWEWARRAWEILAQLYASVGESTKREDALRSRAMLFVRQARTLEAQGAKAMLVADRLEQGIRELLRLGLRDDAETTKPELARAQRRQLDEMVTLSSGTIDLTKEAERAQKAVALPTWREAILALVGLVMPQSVDYLRKKAEESREKHPFQFLIAHQTLDGHGRTAATTADDEAALVADMVDKVLYFARLNAIGVIDPARQHVLANHSPGLDEWADLLREGVVPHGRLESWAKALDAGFRGDWLVSLHLLIPQVENLVREALESHGHGPTSFQPGFEVSNAFGGLLEHPALPKIFPPDLVFELKALFVAREGMNLRNLLAHGQLPDGVYHADNCAYVWHLGLRLTLVVVLNRELSKDGVEER